MTTAVSLQRTLRVLSPWFDTKVSWLKEATPLERVGIARFDSLGLEQLSHKPLSSIEALAGATNANPERQADLLALVAAQRPSMSPAYLKSVMSDTWSLGTDPHWKTLPPQTQLLMARYAALTKHFLRPKHSGDVSTTNVMDVFNTTSPDIQTDAMLQSIIAANNPAHFKHLLVSGIPIDARAKTIGYLNGQTLNRTDYSAMDNQIFASLIGYDTTQSRGGDMFARVLDANHQLHRYPWDKLPTVLEYHPARFLQSVLTNPEVASSLNHVKRWFVPMLEASIARASQDPVYADELLSVVFSTGGRKNFEKTMTRHAPEAHAALVVARQLYGDDPAGSKEPALRGWIQQQASKHTQPLVELPHLDATLFYQAALGA